MIKIPDETIFFVRRYNSNLLGFAYNVASRRSLAFSLDGFKSLHEPNNENKITIYESEFFYCKNGMLENASNINFKPEIIGKVKQELFINELIKRRLVYDNKQYYDKQFNDKKNILDQTSIGNFHQILGQKLLIDNKLSPNEWWINQKFDKERVNLRSDNLYGVVQEPSVKAYLSTILNNEMVVLDYGCGIGYFSNLIANEVKFVYGIDPNDDYINYAKKNQRKNLKFLNFDPSSDINLMFNDHTFDLIYISDVLLFYFKNYNGKHNLNITTLIQKFYNLLKPSGKIVSVEPHCAFFLSPRLGNKNLPFTVLSEYRHKKYSINDNLENFFDNFLNNGFKLKMFKELYPKNFDENNLDFSFSNNFPQWQFCLFEKDNE